MRSKSSRRKSGSVTESDGERPTSPHSPPQLPPRPDDMKPANEKTPIMKSLQRTFSKSQVVVKILLVGDSGVGKTCLLNRFTEGKYSNVFGSTIGIDFKVKTVIINDRKVLLQIWDTSGQMRFRKIISAYFRGAAGIMIVYDLTNPITFRNIPTWIQNIRREAADAELMLVGAKSDMAEYRTVVPADAEELGVEFDINSFMETSAKTGDGVEDAFLEFAKILLDKQNSEKKKKDSSVSSKSRKDDDEPDFGRKKDSFYLACCRAFCFSH